MMVQPLVMVVFVVVLAMLMGQTCAQCPASSPPGAGAKSGNAKVVTALGVRLQQELLAASKDNVFLSPYSVWSALTLAYLGAQGTTEAQMRQGLGVSSQAEAFTMLKGMETRVAGVTQRDPHLSFQHVNRMYVNTSITLKECQEELTEYLAPLDFSQSTAAAQSINDFVSTTTSGLIPSIVTPAMLNDVLMALVSAVYYKGTWKYQFEPQDTKQSSFYPTPNGAPVTIDMMKMTANLHWGKSEELGALVVQLPYTTGSMYLLLPTEEGEEALDRTVRALNAPALKALSTSLEKSDIDVRLPRFTIKGTYGDQLIQALENLGMTHMFDAVQADFSTYHPNLYLKTLVHSAVMEVNEQGSEAAAATLGTFVEKMKARVIECNRPFLFVIPDPLTSAAIFMGVLRNPSQ